MGVEQRKGGKRKTVERTVEGETRMKRRRGENKRRKGKGEHKK